MNVSVRHICAYVHISNNLLATCPRHQFHRFCFESEFKFRYCYSYHTFLATYTHNLYTLGISEY